MYICTLLFGYRELVFIVVEIIHVLRHYIFERRIQKEAFACFQDMKEQKLPCISFFFEVTTIRTTKNTDTNPFTPQ